MIDYTKFRRKGRLLNSSHKIITKDGEPIQVTTQKRCWNCYQCWWTLRTPIDSMLSMLQPLMDFSTSPLPWAISQLFQTCIIPERFKDLGGTLAEPGCGYMSTASFYVICSCLQSRATCLEVSKLQKITKKKTHVCYNLHLAIEVFEN